VARASDLPVPGDNAAVTGDIVNTAIWLLFVQALLGAFDTLYYHEYRLRLPHAHGTRTELRLHASRDFAYATIIGSLGFLTWNGLLAWALCALLLAEIGITIWDFIEEDPPAAWRRTRDACSDGNCVRGLPRVSHPRDPALERQPHRIRSQLPRFPAFVLSGLAMGVFLSGVRDLLASARVARQ
jgi:hypothetical protein